MFNKAEAVFTRQVLMVSNQDQILNQTFYHIYLVWLFTLFFNCDLYVTCGSQRQYKLHCCCPGLFCNWIYDMTIQTAGMMHNIRHVSEARPALKVTQVGFKKSDVMRLALSDSHVGRKILFEWHFTA